MYIYLHIYRILIILKFQRLYIYIYIYNLGYCTIVNIIFYTSVYTRIPLGQGAFKAEILGLSFRLSWQHGL